MIDVGSRCRPQDRGVRRLFHRLCDFLDDLEYRIPTLYKVSPMIEFIYERTVKNKELTGLEIGVFRGINAHSILSFLPIMKLYLVDPYREYEDYEENWIPEHSQTDFDNDYEIAKNRLKKFEEKIQFIKAMSVEAASLIPNDLDFCYIDGNHDYEYVKQDIELYYPKIRQSGVLGGDNFEVEFQGVPQAVLEFVDKMNLKLYGVDKDWWVVKGLKR